MQQWRDEGIILGSTRHGEQSAVLYLFTRANGRANGYLRGAQTSKTRPIIQPGNLVAATWQSRLAEQLGYFTIEPVQALSMKLMQTPELALALQSTVQMLLAAMPERQAYPDIYDATKSLLQTLHNTNDWAQAYIWWEVHLLRNLGFGLRLDTCVETETRDNLTHVSPKSGHAVCRDSAKPYADRLLKLPHFLGGADDLGEQEINTGFALTGYFLNQEIMQTQNKFLPEARQRLAALMMQPVSTRSTLSHLQIGRGQKNG